MDIKTDKNLAAILRTLQEAQKPLGGTRIAKSIQAMGINLSPRTVRYYLAMADKAGFTKNLGTKRGRLITPEGIKEVKNACVVGKIGMVAAKIDALCYTMNFSMAKLKGNIVLNISTIAEADLEKSLSIIAQVFLRGLGMGCAIAIRKAKTTLGNYAVPEGRTAIATVCSVTINGIFLEAGIPVFSRFGGLLEMRQGRPVRFTELIEYSGSTLDPLEIFIKGHMTSVAEAVSTGNGVIGASFREIPAVAIPEANKIKKKLEQVGLSGIMLIGNPGQALLDIPVAEGRAAMVVVGGLNPIAACEEKGIETHSIAMKTLFPFQELSRLET